MCSWGAGLGGRDRGEEALAYLLPARPSPNPSACIPLFPMSLATQHQNPFLYVWVR
jgi:hypothetical protein